MRTKQTRSSAYFDPCMKELRAITMCRNSEEVTARQEALSRTYADLVCRACDDDAALRKLATATRNMCYIDNHCPAYVECGKSREVKCEELLIEWAREEATDAD